MEAVKAFKPIMKLNVLQNFMKVQYDRRKHKVNCFRTYVGVESIQSSFFQAKINEEEELRRFAGGETLSGTSAVFI